MVHINVAGKMEKHVTRRLRRYVDDAWTICSDFERVDILKDY